MVCLCTYSSHFCLPPSLVAESRFELNKCGRRRRGDFGEDAMCVVARAIKSPASGATLGTGEDDRQIVTIGCFTHTYTRACAATTTDSGPGAECW